MHVVERTDTFTLVGGDARRGKLTLFAAEGPRERGVLERIVVRGPASGRGAQTGARRGRVRGRERRRRAGRRRPRRRDARGRGGRRRRRFRPRPRRAQRARPRRDGVRVSPSSGSSATATGSPWTTGTSCCARATRTRASARCSTTSRSSSTVPTASSRRRARAGSTSTNVVDAPNTLAVFVCGPGSHPARVRRAQAGLLAGLRPLGVPDLVVAGAGMAGLVAAAEATASRRTTSSSTRRATAPGGSMLLSSGVIWRHRELERLPRASAPGATSSSSGSSTSASTATSPGSSSSARRVVERSTGNPAHDRRPVRHTVADGGARAAGGGDPARRAAPRASRAGPGRPRDRRVPGEPGARAGVGSRPRPTRCFLRATPWSTGDGPRARPRGRGIDDRRAGRVLRAQHARAAGAHHGGAVRPARAALRASRE